MKTVNLTALIALCLAVALQAAITVNEGTDRWAITSIGCLGTACINWDNTPGFAGSLVLAALSAIVSAGYATGVIVNPAPTPPAAAKRGMTDLESDLRKRQLIEYNVKMKAYNEATSEYMNRTKSMGISEETAKKMLEFKRTGKTQNINVDGGRSAVVRKDGNGYKVSMPVHQNKRDSVDGEVYIDERTELAYTSPESLQSFSEKIASAIYSNFGSSESLCALYEQQAEVGGYGYLAIVLNASPDSDISSLGGCDSANYD